MAKSRKGKPGYPTRKEKTVRHEAEDAQPPLIPLSEEEMKQGGEDLGAEGAGVGGDGGGARQGEERLPGGGKGAAGGDRGGGLHDPERGAMKTWDLSGLGGGYEEMCQRMLWRGVAYLGEVKPSVDMWEQAKAFSGVYGLLMTDGSDLRGLEDAIIRPGDDATGAMHHCVMGHLSFIHQNGIEKWHEELAKARPDEGPTEYVWDGK
jgi:hypothetical protein